jgi:hypothetical protein
MYLAINTKGESVKNEHFEKDTCGVVDCGSCFGWPDWLQKPKRTSVGGTSEIILSS